MYGRCDELLTPAPRPEPVIAEWTTGEAICHRNAIGYVCTDLLTEVLETLRSRNRSLLCLEVSLVSETAEPIILQIRLTRPNDSLPHLLKLLELKLETQPVPEWLHTIRLEASETAVQQTRQRDLFTRQESLVDAGAVQRLTDRLAARLGSDSVVRSQRLPEAVPEQAVRYVPLSEAMPDTPSPDDCMAATSRPLVLLTKPEPVRVTASEPGSPPEHFWWNRQSYSVAYSTRVERIASAWWQDDGSIHRDYYRVETVTGARFWLFRDRRNNWFLHWVFE